MGLAVPLSTDGTLRSERTDLRLCSWRELGLTAMSVTLQGPLHFDTHVFTDECQLARLSVSQTEGTVCTNTRRQKEQRKRSSMGLDDGGRGLWRELGP